MALRPAHDVYHRLRWDPAVDEATAEVVVLDRRRGRVTMPFAAFDPHGDIPWSRVLGFRLDGEVVWDREARIDRVFGTGSTPGQVLRSSPPEPVDEAALRVLTLNVLFDRYDREAIQTPLRTPKLLALLDQLDTDLVALQEVEPWLCERLRDEGVLERYHATDDGTGHTVEPYGQLLLSRFPITGSQVLPLGGDKRHLVASVALPSGRATVAVVHLSSDRHDDASERRARQLAALRPRLGLGPVLVLGDVNHDDPVDLPLDDAWLARRPDEPGYTWDPSRNVLARLISRTGARRRLDRVLVRGFAVDEIEIVGVDSSDVPLSDHHGVLATLRAVADEPLAESWILPLPASVARVLEPLRRRFDPGRFRWPPHLTLERTAFRPSTNVTDAVTTFAGRTLTLSAATRFVGPPRRIVATLDEAGTKTVHELRQALGMTDEGLPHVTVGAIDNPDVEVAVLRALTAALPLTFPVLPVDHVVRTDAGPVRRIVSLPGPVRDPSWGEVLDHHGLSWVPDEAPAELLAAVRDATGGAPHVVGSARLGAQLPEGDLDIVLRHDDAPASHAALRRLGGTTVTGAVDVTRLTWPLGTPPLPRSVDVSVVGTDGPGPEAVWATLAAKLDDDGVTVLRALKGWAVARQVHDPAWGYLPGLALALVVAETTGSGSVRFLAALERVRDLAGRLADGEDPALPEVRFTALPAVARTLVEEAERALVLGWDDHWSEVFTSATPELDAGVDLDLAGAPADRLVGWLRGRVAFVLTSLQEGSGALLRLRPHPRPTRRRGGVLRFALRWAGAEESAVRRALAELHDRFAHSDDRPPGATLQVEVLADRP